MLEWVARERPSCRVFHVEIGALAQTNKGRSQLRRRCHVVYLDYGIPSGVVARWALALGVEMALSSPLRVVLDDSGPSSGYPAAGRHHISFFADFYGRNVNIFIEVTSQW